MRLEQQRLAICPLGIGEVCVPAGAVGSRLEQRQQAKIVERTEAQLGIERGSRPREARARERGIACGQSGGPRVVPSGVIVLMRLQLRQVRRSGAPRIASVPRLLRLRARPLRLRYRGRHHEQRDQRRGAATQCLHDQHRGGEQQRDPGTRSPALGATLRCGGALVRSHEVAHRAGLIGKLGRHNRSLRRIGHGAQHVVVPAGLDGIAGSILLPAEVRAAVIAHRNLRGLATAFRDENQVDAEAGESMRFLQRPFERIVRLAIREHDQHAIGDLRAGMQQVDALGQRRRQ